METGAKIEIDNVDVEHAILYTAAESIRIITALLYPILPYATANVWRNSAWATSKKPHATANSRTSNGAALNPAPNSARSAPSSPAQTKDSHRS